MKLFLILFSCWCAMSILAADVLTQTNGTTTLSSSITSANFSSVTGFMGVCPFVTASTKYVAPFGAIILSATTETNTSQVLPFTCTFTNLYVRFNSLGSGTNVVVTLVTNGSASNLSASINGNNGIISGSDTTHGVTVTAGGLVSFSVLGNNAQANANNVMLTCQYYQQ